jgi:outer membrane protein TolC
VVARDVAEQSLEKLRAAAKAGRVQTSTVEGAEAVLADAQKKLDKLLANHKTYRTEIEAILKKLEPQEK